MPISTLDPISALIVIDLQQGIVAGAAPGRTEYNMPMGRLPADWADLVPELGRRPDDHLVTKQRWGASHDTDLHTYLVSRGATQVLLAGIATSVGVESTARSERP